MFCILILLNGFVMHQCSNVITLEELQMNQILLGSKILKFKNILPIFIFFCSLFTVIKLTGLVRTIISVKIVFAEDSQ